MTEPRERARRISRRRALQAGAGFAALAGGFAAASLIAPHTGETAVITKLSQALPRDPAIAAMGRTFLRTTPQAGSRRLVAAVAGRLGLSRDALIASDDDEIQRRVRAQILRDYADGAVTRVEGWVVSRSFVEIAALRVLGA